MEEDEGNEDYNLESLFTNENYVEKLFTFDDISINLLCSSMSSVSL